MTGAYRAPVFDANTRLFEPSYERGIRQALRKPFPDGIPPAVEEEFWRRLAAVVEGYDTIMERRTRRPPKDELARWKRIDALLVKLGKEFGDVDRGIPWNAADLMFAKRALQGLWSLKDTKVTARVEGYGSIVEGSSSGRGVAQLFLYGAILDLWLGLGRGLRISRSTRNGKENAVGGPLVDFFEACVRPILGDDAMPTPAGIAKIVVRKKLRHAKIDRGKIISK